MPSDFNFHAAVRELRFGDDRLRAALDLLDIDELIGELGEPRRLTIVRESDWRQWRPGDGRPRLADDDPAVMCALGHCLFARWRGWIDTVDSIASRIHPAHCGWCDYPLAELQAAAEWATWHMQEVLVEVVLWRGQGGGGATYERFLEGGIRHPRWKTFAALPGKEQAYQVEQVLKSARQAVPA
jgi:hypothetical protein